MSESQELIVIPTETAMAVFSADDGLQPYLAKIRAELDAFTPDVSTKKGRDAIASIAHKVARSKTYLDGVGKDLVAELKELPKKIDASRMHAEHDAARLLQEADRLERTVLIPFKPVAVFELEAWSCAERTRLAEREQFLQDPDADPRLQRALRDVIQFEQTGRWPERRYQP